MKLFVRLLASALLVFALGAGLCACTGGSSGSSNTAANNNAVNAAAANNGAKQNVAANNANANANKNSNKNANNQASANSSLTFRSYSLMKSHYEKHGIDMGFSSMEDYLAAANAVVANPKSLHKKESEDNDDIYYLESTNEIVFVSEDGYIRTYFCPDSGKKYYDKQ